MSDGLDRVKERVIALYEAGATAQEVGRRFGYGAATVMRWVAEASEAGRVMRRPAIVTDIAHVWDRAHAEQRAPVAAASGALAARETAPDALSVALEKHTAALILEYAALCLPPPDLP